MRRVRRENWKMKRVSKAVKAARCLSWGAVEKASFTSTCYKVVETARPTTKPDMKYTKRNDP